jgi:glycine/D-amino acid oxidase-like deaminating enzyme/nitrite reductase/ring-hydroxylating ferredoxin subunit
MASVWVETGEIGRYGALEGGVSCDIVVVGGGWIGLTTALLLAQEGADVVLIEGGRLAARTSGNTTGKITSQHGAMYSALRDRQGNDVAQLYADANQNAVTQVAEIAERLAIDCELSRTPSYVYTTDPANSLSGEAEAAASLGLPAQLVDGQEVGVPAAAAVRFDNQLQLHPVRYLAGLARALTDAGGRIYEQSRATSIDDTGDGIEVTVAPGHILRGRRAVVATLLPIGTIGGYFARTTPEQSHGIAVRLPVEAPTGMTISADSPIRSTRPWPGGGPNGLVVVGSDHKVGKADDTRAAYQALVDWVGSTWNFDAQPEYRWSAHDYVSADLLPYAGRAPGSDAILIATGMHKWGLSNGTAAAGVLRDLILDRDNPSAALYDAGRIGDARSVGALIKNNAEVGKDFATGHAARILTSGLDHVEVGEGGLYRRDGRTVGAYCDQDGELHTVKPVCTHLGCSLAWNQADTTWDCNCHGSRFSPDGSVLDGPATRPLDAD